LEETFKIASSAAFETGWNFLKYLRSVSTLRISTIEFVFLRHEYFVLLLTLVLCLKQPKYA
jgi:hypothetical protein